MISDSADPTLTPDGHADPLTGLDANHAIWLRRGQRLGELLLTSRKHAAFVWSASLVLAGGSLVLLALIGTPVDHDRRQSIYEPPILSYGAKHVSSSHVTQTEKD